MFQVMPLLGLTTSQFRFDGGHYSLWGWYAERSEYNRPFYVTFIQVRHGSLRAGVVVVQVVGLPPRERVW